MRRRASKNAGWPAQTSTPRFHEMEGAAGVEASELEPTAESDHDATLVGKVPRAEHFEGPFGSVPAPVVYGAVCAMLSLQNSAYALLRRYQRSVLHEDIYPQSMLAVMEVVKTAFCMYMLLLRPAMSSSPQQAPRVECASIFNWATLKMAVPALLYVLMSLLGFAALQRCAQPVQDARPRATTIPCARPRIKIRHR